MKKLALVSASAGIALCLSGCISGMKTDSSGFATAPAGVLISDMKGGQFIQHRELDTRKYKIIGIVRAEAMTVNYLGLVSQGDASYQTLKRQALEEHRDADDLINIEMDFKHDNLLGIVNKVYINMTATAIKYVK